jgi:hypothetical protein
MVDPCLDLKMSGWLQRTMITNVAGMDTALSSFVRYWNETWTCFAVSTWSRA